MTTDFLTGTVKGPGELPHEYISAYKQICEKMPPLPKAAFLGSHLYGQKNCQARFNRRREFSIFVIARAFIRVTARKSFSVNSVLSITNFRFAFSSQI